MKNFLSRLMTVPAMFLMLSVAMVAGFAAWDTPLSPDGTGVGLRGYAYQDLNDTVNNSATAVPTDLTVALAANQKIKIRYYVPVTLAGTAGGVKFVVNAPASVAAYVVSCALFTDADSLGLTTTITSEAAFGVTLANAGTHWAVIDADITNGATAGTVVLEFAQNSAQSENCIVLRGAFADWVKF